MTDPAWDDARHWADTDLAEETEETEDPDDLEGPADVGNPVGSDGDGADGHPDSSGGRPAPGGAGGAAAGREAPPLYYATLDAFVRDLLAPTYRRPVDGRNRCWCPQWWRHAEAIARLEALWRAWEHLRLDPATGTSVWFRDHADHHMTVLLDPDAGPFKYCGPDKGHSARLEPLPLEDPPAGLFK